MSLLDLDPDFLSPGLLPGAFRGVPFYVPDARHEAGRRTLRTLFPGLDASAIEDLGLHRGVIEIVGLIVGDDYVAQAEALRAACETPGPGMLLHPWLGERLVVVAEAASISFSTRELRLARIRVGFFPADEPIAPFSTLPLVLAAVAGLAGRAELLIAAALSASPLPVGLWAAARTTAGAVAAIVGAAAAARQSGADALAQSLRTPLAALDAARAKPPGGDAAAALAAAVAGLATPVATLAIGPSAPAIGPASPAVETAAVLGAREGTDLLIGIAAEILATAAASAPEQAVRLGAAAAAMAQAARTLAEIPHESRQEAMGWRGRMLAALDALDAAAAAVAPDAPDAIAKLLAAAAELRSSVSRDVNEAIGRLPEVIVVTPPAAVSAWLIAQHFAGDDPRRVVAMLDDIVRRNRLRHPGSVAGPIEVLA